MSKTELTVGKATVRILNLNHNNEPCAFYQMPGGHWVCEVPPATEFAVQLENNWGERAEWTLEIDGKKMVKDAFSVRAWGTMAVERPEGEAKRFTVDAEDGEIAKEAGVQAGAKENGFVKIHYKPGKKQVYKGISKGRSRDYDREGSRGGYPRDRYNEMQQYDQPQANAAVSALQYAQTEASRPPRGAAAAVPMMAFQSAPAPSEFKSAAVLLGNKSSQEFTDVPALKAFEKDEEQLIQFRLVVRKKPRFEAVRNVDQARLVANPPPRVEDM
jgi:hypothetical protein